VCILKLSVAFSYGPKLDIFLPVESITSNNFEGISNINFSSNFVIVLAIITSKLVLFSKYNYNDQVKRDEMGRPCSTNGGEEECI
jgi:hypothetical protein